MAGCGRAPQELDEAAVAGEIGQDAGRSDRDRVSFPSLEDAHARGPQLAAQERDQALQVRLGPGADARDHGFQQAKADAARFLDGSGGRVVRGQPVDRSVAAHRDRDRGVLGLHFLEPEAHRADADLVARPKPGALDTHALHQRSVPGAHVLEGQAFGLECQERMPARDAAHG